MGKENVGCIFYRQAVVAEGFVDQFSEVRAILETTQGQIQSFFGQLPCKCFLLEVASVGD